MEKVEMELAGRTLSLKTGEMAKQADGAVLAQYGDTVVLGTVVASRQMKEDRGFLPLFVEYREKTYAAGKIPGGFFKREGRPTEKETLSARLIDRPIRPFFPEGFRNEVQIIVNVLSADRENDPDVLGVIAASAALAVSDIPFPTALGAVRIGIVDGEYVVCPTHEQVDNGTLSLAVVGMENKVVMIDGYSSGVKEQEIVGAVKLAVEQNVRIAGLVDELRKKCGKEKREIELIQIDDEFKEAVGDFARDKLIEILGIENGKERDEAIHRLVSDVSGKFGEERAADIDGVFENIRKEYVHERIFKEGKRADGRAADELRSISCEVGVLPRTHGSALFTRGETQSLAVTTLGTSDDEQLMEELKGESSKSFMLHYNFPPFSVGEVKPMRGPGRREIGHGVIAERALKPILPAGSKFPYTVRIVSDILESNGSSSMATVCAGCLALMDAGVPISNTVAGVAMGLLKDGDNSAVLTDIAGAEDHFGDMDFKVAGTRDGVTAIQMDVKIHGIDPKLVEDVLNGSREARGRILDSMEKVISRPRENLSSYAPRILTMQVKPDKIGKVIGPSGKTIKGIVAKTGAEVNIEDDGTVCVSSVDEQQAKEALAIIEGLVAEAEVGKVYSGIVQKITDFGAFVEILPGQDGLVHISQLADHHVKKVEDILDVGDKVEVKVVSVDDQGRIKLSRKAVTGKSSKHTSH